MKTLMIIPGMAESIKTHSGVMVPGEPMDVSDSDAYSLLKRGRVQEMVPAGSQEVEPKLVAGNGVKRKKVPKKKVATPPPVAGDVDDML